MISQLAHLSCAVYSEPTAVCVCGCVCAHACSSMYNGFFFLWRWILCPCFPGLLLLSYNPTENFHHCLKMTGEYCTISTQKALAKPLCLHGFNVIPIHLAFSYPNCYNEWELKHFIIYTNPWRITEPWAQRAQQLNCIHYRFILVTWHLFWLCGENTVPSESLASTVTSCYFHTERPSVHL